MKLNLGCGNRILNGYCNVDKFGEPDVKIDLEMFPWPWPDNSVEEVLLIHVLEHLGQSPDVFISVIKELYRICNDHAKIKIIVPHPRHDHFIMDPTHVRPITPALISMFSKKNNHSWLEQGGANTPLALYHDVDFDIVSTSYTLAEPYQTDFNDGRISLEDVVKAIAKYNNIATQIEINIVAVKSSLENG
jgi:hypothetical protein